MNIKILQAENSIENVDRSVISALYNAHINGDISLEVDNNNQKVGLVGSITAPAGYAILVSTLNSAYPKFHVTVNSEYISFEDTNVELILLNIGLGDGVGITVLAAGNATFTSSTFLNNTTITSFNEFSYFTKANTNPPVNLFSGCTNLTEIDLTSAEKISDGEFRLCGITSANLSSISVINNNAFSDSSLGGDLNIPNLISMGPNAFYNCTNLTKVSCLGKISAIPERAFVNYKNASEALLLEVILPYECLSLSGACFLGQSSLKTVKLYTQSIDSGLTLVASNLLRITTFGGYCFFNCSSLLSIDISNAVSISERAFNYTQLSGQLNLPNLNNLGLYAFADSKISEISNLGSITSVPDMCFNNCDSLTTVTLPNSCTSINGGAFAYCDALTSIDLGGTTTIGNQAFIADSSLTTVTGISNLTSIGNNAFLSCPITGTLNLLNLTSLGSTAFQLTSITSILSLGNVTTIPNNCFLGCTSLTGTINLPNVTTIREWAFRSCTALSSINLQNVETIGYEAFKDCTSLTLITLPTTLRTISWTAFRGTSLQKFIIPEGCTTMVDGLGNSANHSLQYIEIPSTINDIGMGFHRAYESSYSNSIYLVIKATTPPKATFYDKSWETIGSNQYGVGAFAGIYVPDAALSTYQDTANLTDDQIGWKVAAVQAKLKKISLLLSDSPIWWAEYLTRAL